MPTLPTIWSPTGRNPTLLWTQTQQNTLAQMQKDATPLFNVLAGEAAMSLAGTAPTHPARPYGDQGQWSALWYQITGDQAHGRNAVELMTAQLGNRDPNWLREYAWEFIILQDWLTPVMSALEVATFRTAYQAWCDWYIDTGTPNAGTGLIRLGDSDALIGGWHLAALTDVVTGSSNLTRTANSLASAAYDSKVPMGGLDATGANQASIRNQMAFYVQQMKGGTFLPSTFYGPGDLKLWICNWLALQTALGRDCEPEFAALLSELDIGLPYLFFPNGQDNIHFGDCQDPQNPGWFGFMPFLALLAGVTQSKWASDLFENDFNILAKTWLYGIRDGLWRAFYRWNPYQPRIAAPTQPPYRFYPNMGQAAWNDGNVVAFHHLPLLPQVDHQKGCTRDGLLYVGNEYVLNHCIGYGGQSGLPDAANSISFWGLPNSVYNRRITGQSGGSNFIWSSCQGVGNYYGPGRAASKIPPDFLKSHTQTIVDLIDGLNVTRLIRDVVQIGPLLNPELYDQADAAAITAVPVRTFVHAPVKPTISSNVITWTTAGGQNCNVQFVGTQPDALVIVDETVDFGPGSTSDMDVSQKKWHVACDFLQPNPTILQFACVGAVPPIVAKTDGATVGNWTISFAADGQATVTIGASPQPVPAPPNPPTPPALAVGQPFVAPDGMTYTMQMTQPVPAVPVLVRKQ